MKKNINYLLIFSIALNSIVLGQNKYTKKSLNQYTNKPITIMLLDSSSVSGTIIILRESDLVLNKDDGNRIMIQYSDIVSFDVKEGKIAIKAFSKLMLYGLAILLGIYAGSLQYY